MAREDKSRQRPVERRSQPHAWKGTWNRPLKVDEATLDPLTVARMTDHNVRGSDDEKKTAKKTAEKK